jgi:hypothetical protein
MKKPEDSNYPNNMSSASNFPSKKRRASISGDNASTELNTHVSKSRLSVTRDKYMKHQQNLMVNKISQA